MGKEGNAQASDEHQGKFPVRKSVLTKSYNYREVTKNGEKGFQIGEWEAHHILCDHAMTGREITTNRQYIEDCLWNTEWDINNADNLMGLPTNKQFKNASETDMVGFPKNFCSHQVDHNTKFGYTDECKQYLQEEIWDTLNDKQIDHKINAENIKKALIECTKVFAKRLVKRGKRCRGTVFCWQKRFEKNMKDKWYFPFSMARKPNRRNPGESYEILDKAFKKIKISLG